MSRYLNTHMLWQSKACCALGRQCLNACCHQPVTAVLPVRGLSREEKWSGEVCMLCQHQQPGPAASPPVQWTRGRLERCLARCLAACVPLFQGTDRGMSQLSLQLHWQTSPRRQRRTYQRTLAIWFNAVVVAIYLRTTIAMSSFWLDLDMTVRCQENL